MRTIAEEDERIREVTFDVRRAFRTGSWKATHASIEAWIEDELCDCIGPALMELRVLQRMAEHQEGKAK